MPECVLSAYLDQIPRLRAERALDAAQVNALPWMKDGDRQAWYEAQHGRMGLVEPEASDVWMPFTWNGQRVGKEVLKSKVAGALGSGLST
jgi:hypothetical protein